MTPFALWGSASAIYLVFFLWYTNLGGPLTDDEISDILQTLRGSGADAGRLANVESFLRGDTGRDFIMINLLDMNETPPELPATGPGAAPGDLIDHYMEHMYAAQLARASHPVFFGRAIADAMDIAGIEGAEHWEQGALFRYRSRRDMMDIVTDPRFSERHDYKMGALTKTIAYPVEAVLHPGDVRILLALLLISITAIIHLAVSKKPAGSGSAHQGSEAS